MILQKFFEGWRVSSHNAMADQFKLDYKYVKQCRHNAFDAEIRKKQDAELEQGVKITKILQYTIMGLSDNLL